MSTKDLEKEREKQTTFMKEQLEHLKVQEEFTALRAGIAENILREYMAKVKHASLKAPPEDESNKA